MSSTAAAASSTCRIRCPFLGHCLAIWPVWPQLKHFPAFLYDSTSCGVNLLTLLGGLPPVVIRPRCLHLGLDDLCCCCPLGWSVWYMHSNSLALSYNFSWESTPATSTPLRNYTTRPGNLNVCIRWTTPEDNNSRPNPDGDNKAE